MRSKTPAFFKPTSQSSPAKAATPDNPNLPDVLDKVAEDTEDVSAPPAPTVEDQTRAETLWEEMRG